MDEYLGAPLVADLLRRFDCVPSVSGADAIVVAGRPNHGPAVRVRSLVRSFNPDQQSGDGLETPLAGRAPGLWSAAGVAPADVDLACVYDDYPAMVLAQLRDLGFVPDDDLVRFVRGRDQVRAGGPAINTSGGMLSCGQAGAAGGLHGLVEATRQLQHRARGRQVPRARLAVVSGYGMMLYRYGAAAGAAILERVS
jgi:acetyl-CoA acetyltransferase